MDSYNDVFCFISSVDSLLTNSGTIQFGFFASCKAQRFSFRFCNAVSDTANTVNITESIIACLMALNITIRVKAAMKKEIVSIDKDDSIRSAIRKMVKGDMGSVVVDEDGKPVGIVTERDILKSIAYKRASTEGRVGTIMSTPLISIDAYATLGEAAEKMIKHKVRRLLVKENNNYVGIITQRDLQSLMADTFKALLLE